MWNYDLDTIQHFGVKGMKWGVRRAIKKQAKQDYDAEAKRKSDQLLNQAKKNYAKSDALDIDVDDKASEYYVKAMGQEQAAQRIKRNYARGNAVASGVLASLGGLAVTSQILGETKTWAKSKKVLSIALPVTLAGTSAAAITGYVRSKKVHDKTAEKYGIKSVKDRVKEEYSKY